MIHGLAYDETELDALREVSNIGAGAAATELYRLTGSGVEMQVPRSQLLTLDRVLGAYGEPATPITAIGVEISGQLDMPVVVLIDPDDVPSLDAAARQHGEDLLVELGERMCSAYAHAIGDLTGAHLTSSVVGVATDMLGAVVQTLVAPNVGDADAVLLLDVDFGVERLGFGVRLLCAPRGVAVGALLDRLGIGRDQP